MDAADMLHRIRTILEITRAELARLAQLSPSTVGRIEKRTLDPTWGTLTRILEETGFRIQGDDVVPLCDRSAAAAARIELDKVFYADDEDFPPLTPSEAAEVWRERWRRAGWITDPPSFLHLGRMASVAATLADHAGLPGPTLSIGHARRWREIALRIDEIGADYAVSDLAMAHEVPRASLQVQPKIYVRDPATVAALLREEESPPGHGVLLIGTEGPELEGAADGHALRFTSIGQALIDGLAGTGRGSARAEVALHWWLLENLRPWERWEGRSARLGPTDRTVPESRARAAHASVDAPTDTGTRRSTYEHEEEHLRPGPDGRAAP